MDGSGAERIGLEGYLGLLGWSGPVAAMMRDEMALRQSTDDVTRAFTSLSPGMANTEQQTKKTDSSFQSLTQSAQKVNSTLTGIGRTLLGTGLGVTTLTGLIMGLGGEAASLQGVQAAFENLGGSLETMQEATQGLVSSKQLMQSFNRAAMLVSRDFAQELPEAMGYLQQVAMATGDSMDYLLNSIVIGVGRLSPLILDNLGISIKLSDAYEEWSAKTGIATKEMSKSQQQVAVMDATMAALRRNFGDTSAATSTAAMEAMRFRTRMEELKLAVGEAMIPMLNEMYPAMENFAKAVLEFFGSPEFKQSMENTATKLGEILETIQKLQKSSPLVITIAGGLATWGLFGGILTKIGTNLGQVGKAIQWIAGTAIPWLVLKGAYVYGFFQEMISWIPTAISGAIGAALSAIGAAAAGVVLLQADTNKSIEESRREQFQITADELARSSASYEAYKAAVIEAYRAARPYAADMTDLRIETLLLADNTILAEEAFDDFVNTVDAAEPRFRDSGESFQRMQQYIADYASGLAQAARRTGDAIEDVRRSWLQGEVSVLQESSLGWQHYYQEQARQYAEAMASVRGFGPLRQVETEFYNWDMALRKDQLSRILQWQQQAEDATEQHAEAMLDIQEDYQKRSVEAEFQYQLQVQQATIDYQAQHAAAVAYGNEEAARDLQTKHEIEIEQMRISYEQQVAETERGMIEQQIVRQEAYITQLEAAKEQYLSELGLQLGQNEKFMLLGAAFQNLYYAQFAEGDARILKKSAEDAMAQLQITQSLNEGELASTIQTVQGIINARNEELAAAQGNLTAMQAAYEKAKAGIMAATVVTPFDPAQFKLSEAATKAASRAGTSATSKLSQVASDISKAVEDAESAIWKLATFTIPEGTKAGLERLSDYLVMAVKALYAGYDDLRKTIKDKGIKRLAEGTQYIQTAVGIIEPAIDTLTALAEYESVSDLPERMSTFIYDLYDTVGMLGDFALSINKDWLKKVSKQVEPLTNVFSVVSPMVEAMAALADYQTGNLEETLDVFEADIMTLLGRLGSIGARMTVEGIADAKLFQMGAQQIAAGINSGLALIQETAGELIDINFGGAATYVPVAVNQSLAQMLGAGASRTVTVTFGDVYLQNETDWARLETMVRQVVTEEVWS